MIRPDDPCSYEIRAATGGDLEFAVELNRISMLPYLKELPVWNDRVGRAEMERRWAADTYQIIMVRGERAGMLAAGQRGTELILKHLELLPRYQGQGIGSAVVRELVAQARTGGLGLTLYVLRSNPARRLYERLGFQVVEKVDTGWRGVKYRMTLERQTD